MRRLRPLLCLAFISVQEVRLIAVPPIDIGLLDSNNVEVSWPNTGEEVQLETSDDMGFWQQHSGAATLINGRFSQPIPLSPGAAYFRLSESQVDPNTPVYVNPPDANPTFFPGQTVKFTLSATDPAGLAIRYLADPLPLPTGASLNMETGEFSWRPTLSQTGNTTVTFLAFNGNTSGRLPITFSIQEPPADGQTSLSGILLDTTNAVGGGNQPVVGAMVSLLETGVAAVTGADGRFFLSGIPGGLQVLDIAVDTAQPAPDGSRYAGFREAITIVPNIANDVPRPFYMPRLAMDSLKTVIPSFTTTVENIDTGTSIVVPPHTAMMGDDEFTGELSISEVPEALAPAALPENLGFGQLVTIQPVGVRFQNPVPITFKNIDQLPPGSETDIWSLDPDAGVFTIVGKGRVTSDGEFIETISGGVIAADWHGTLPPTVSPGDGPGTTGSTTSPTSSSPPGPEGPPEGGHGPGGCPGDSNAPASGPFGSDVLLAEGAVIHSLRASSYLSGTIPRTMTLKYHSGTANPRIVVPLQTTILRRSAVPRRVSMEGTFGGLATRQVVYYDTSGLSENRDETFVGGLVFDASGIKTGFSPYSIRVTSHFVRSAVGSVRTSQAVVHNRVDSPIGAGWGLHGEQRIVRGPANSDRHLLLSGDGSYTLFQDTASAFTLAALGATRAADYSFAEGSLFAQARTAILDSFEGSSILPVDTIGAKTSDLLLLTPYASATQGLVLSSAEKAAFTSFIRGGGAAIVFLDHDLERASFKNAIDSLLTPFGLSGSNTISPGGDLRPSNHPLVSGEFGNVTNLSLPFGGFELETNGTALENIVPGDLPARARIALLPKNALGNGSGPIVFIADTQSFVDNASFGFESRSSNAALLLNAIKFCRQAQRDPAASIEYVGAPNDSSRLIERSNGTFVRRLANGVNVFFNAAGQMSKTVERDGRTTQFAYGAGGTLTEVIDAFGMRTRIQYSGGKLAAIVDPVGRITSFDHDTQGNLVKVIYPDLSSNSFEYDANHLMTAEINALGGRIEHAYDTNGRAQSARLPDGTERKVVSVQGRAIDLAGTAGSEVDPAPLRSPEDLIASYTNAAEETSTVEVGPLGTATRITMPDGTSDQIVRDASGKAKETRFASGRVFTATHDQQGRRITLTDSATGGTWTSVYDTALGVPLLIDNGQGQNALFQYDQQGRRTLYESFTGRQFQSEYNGTAPLPFKTVAFNGLETELSYDVAGNLIKLVQGQGESTRITTLNRNAEGFVSTLTAATGDTFTYGYDRAGRIVTESAPDGASIHYVRNEQGLPTSITLPSGATHRYSYDTRGRMVSSTSPLGTALQTTYHYAFGRLAQVSTTNGPEIRYFYNNGHLASVTTPAGEATFSYNQNGLMERLITPENNDLSYAFDEAGRVISETWTGTVDGVVKRTYDGLGRIASLTVGTESPTPMKYDADNLMLSNGPLTLTRDTKSGLVLGSQLGKCTDERTYNAFGELMTITGRVNANGVYRIELERDKLGRIVSKSETVLGITRQSRYEYDRGGRLFRVVRDGVTVTYDYDANGNRRSRTATGEASETGTYNEGNQIVNYASEAYTYDSAGRLRTRGNDSFVYDALGQLKSASLGGGKAIEYQHDPLGRRIEEKNGGVRRRFIYQNWLQPIAELDGAGGIRSLFGYTSSLATPDFIRRNGSTFRIFSDHQGSPRLVVDCASGEIAQIMRHDEFGRVLEDSTPAFQPFGFAGGLYDTDSQLLRFGARDYDPYTGQWTAMDPIGYTSGSFNLYSYVSGDPVNRIDLDGLKVYDGPSVTVGVTGGVDFLIWGGSLSLGFTFDGTGNVGVSWGYAGGYGAGAEGDLSGMVAVTKGDIYQARGSGYASGGGGGKVIVAEGYRLSDKHGNFTGFQGTAGVGAGATLHHHETYTGVAGFNIPDTYNSVTSWVSSQF